MPAFNSTTPNLNWAVNRLNKSSGLMAGLVKRLQDLASNLQSGTGAIAPNAGIENAVRWAITIADDDSHGYDQNDRWGPDYDCSSFVISAFRAAGYGVSATSTRDMKAGFEALGFTWVEGNPTQNDLKRGDILLNEENHTEIYIGDGQLVGAHCNEFGGKTGGKTGDQDGNEIGTGTFYSFPWDGYLRFQNSQSTIEVPPDVQQSGIIADYTVYSGINWDRGSNQRNIFQLWNTAGRAKAHNICVYNGRYLVAMNSKFGNVGDEVGIYLDNGVTIDAIIADAKNSGEWGNQYPSGWSMVEFEVDESFTGDDLPAQWKNHKLVKVENLGSML